MSLTGTCEQATIYTTNQAVFFPLLSYDHFLAMLVEIMYKEIMIIFGYIGLVHCMLPIFYKECLRNTSINIIYIYLFKQLFLTENRILINQICLLMCSCYSYKFYVPKMVFKSYIKILKPVFYYTLKIQSKI